MFFYIAELLCLMLCCYFFECAYFAKCDREYSVVAEIFDVVRVDGLTIVGLQLLLLFY